MNLSTAYEQIPQRWTPEQLADRYRSAKLQGERLTECEEIQFLPRPVAVLATAVPACATLSVAIHVIHVLREGGDPKLIDQLLDNAERHSAVVLHRCHRALELDGRAHQYEADDWLPVVTDSATSLLEAACLRREPPSFVEHAQDALRWISRAIVELEIDSDDAAAAIADALGRVLALHIFADAVGGCRQKAGASPPGRN